MKLYNVIFTILFSFIATMTFGQKPKSKLVEQKLLISLKDFGAVGDGKNDDSDAFQKAIDYCENNKRKTLFVPFGKYLLKKSVYFKTGGVQLLGEGALLREESWIDRENIKNDVINSSELIVPKDNTGIVFDKNVRDPVRIVGIQFSSQQGRQVGKTTGILFQSEWNGPTWPFIIERCHFTGFNYAIKFASSNQYLVAFMQFRQNAFNQNDECVYFSDINSTNKQSGVRNLAWGFTFEDNMCHDNSRIIRGTFAKDAVNIRNNNMEGNIKYANGNPPSYIVDLEISNATVNFEGNHFEAILSDAVYVSSVFADKNGEYLPFSNTTALNPKNKIFIKGNNLDGAASNFKPFTLKGILVYNYDQVNLFLDQCDLRVNESNEKNVFLTEFAKENGTVIKVPINNGKETLKSYLNTNKQFKKATALNLNEKLSNLKQLKIEDKFLVAKIEVINEIGTLFLGSTTFVITYELNNVIKTISKSVNSNYGFKQGRNLSIAVVPNFLPKNAQNAHFTAMVDYSKNILENRYFYYNTTAELLVSQNPIFAVSTR